jgi:hypothetical protein
MKHNGLHIGDGGAFEKSQLNICTKCPIEAQILSL